MKSFKQYLGEKLKASDDMGDWVKDFQDSDAPQFKGKSKEKRRQMAIAAKLDAEREAGMRKEEVELDESKLMSAADVAKMVAQRLDNQKSKIHRYDQIKVIKDILNASPQKRLATDRDFIDRVLDILYDKHNFREEVELDEISKKTLGSYIKKASDQVSDRGFEAGFKSGRGKSDDVVMKPYKKGEKRLAGIAKATNRLTKEEVELDEVSDKKLDAYRQKAFADQPAGDDGSDKYRKRKFGRDLAFAKQTGRAKVLATKEEVEQIDEKAPGILRKMMLKHKLNKGIRQTAADRDTMIRSGKTWPEMEKEYDKSLAKRDSMKKALARLNKNEEVEQIDEVSTNTMKRLYGIDSTFSSKEAAQHAGKRFADDLIDRRRDMNPKITVTKHPNGKGWKWNYVKEEVELDEIYTEAAKYLIAEGIELEDLNEEQLDELIGAIARGIGRGLKRTVVNKRGNFRFSTAGRADAAERKADKIQRKNDDILRLDRERQRQRDERDRRRRILQARNP